MIKMKNIAFIGAGNMASAIAGGIITSGLVTPNCIYLYDKNTAQYSKFSNCCRKALNLNEAISLADYIFLSVKPQNIKEVLLSINNTIDLTSKVFVSICAGIKIETIEQILGKVKIARAMPNTPLLIGNGTTGICKNELLNDDEFQFVKNIFSSSGFVAAVAEDDMDNVTALSGSGPAYVYLFVKSVVDSASKLGFNNEQSIEMFCNTLIGSANMILNKKQNIDELIRMVTSPNGTTEKALNVLYENEFSEIIYKAMKACADRANELSKLN